MAINAKKSPGVGDFAELSNETRLSLAHFCLDFASAFLCLAKEGVREPEECRHKEHGKHG